MDCSVLCFSFTSNIDSPYTSSVDTWINRYKVGKYSLAASKRLWVPSILSFVYCKASVKDVWTWDCAAKWIICVIEFVSKIYFNKSYDCKFPWIKVYLWEFIMS